MIKIASPFKSTFTPKKKSRTEISPEVRSKYENEIINAHIGPISGEKKEEQPDEFYVL